MSGPIAGKCTKYGGAGAYGSSDFKEDEDDWQPVAPKQPKGQATAIAEYDFGIDKTEEVKYELVSHICASEVQAARTKAGLTQAQLAKKVNEKA